MVFILSLVLLVILELPSIMNVHISVVIVGVIWLSFKPVLAHASCVSSTLLASVKSVNEVVVMRLLGYGH